MTLTEFRVWDDGTDTRYELIEGEIIAMAPAMADHATIVSNLGRALGGVAATLLRPLQWWG